MKRCEWLNLNNQLYVDYHDSEWGHPVYCDNLLFEFLILEGAQAGLSWETILNKRENYKKAFANFDPEKVSRFSQAKIDKLLLNEGIVRNKLKVNSAVINAKLFLEVQKEFGSFSNYLWGFNNGEIIYNNGSQIVPSSPLSETISKDLKKRGFKFVGPTIIHAYLQAVGIIQDHSKECFLHNKKL